MTALVVIASLLAAAIALALLLLEKRPGYGAWYGLAKLSGARLDIGPVDWSALTRRASGNDALACPPAHCPNAKPDFEPAAYPLPPLELLARLTAIALAEARTRSLACGGAYSARFIQYTRLMRFPDTIDVEVLATPGGGATLAIYSRSLIGRADFGVNAARIRRWLATLDSAAGRA